MDKFNERKVYGDKLFSEALKVYLDSYALTFEEMFLVHGLADLAVLLKVKLDCKNRGTQKSDWNIWLNLLTDKSDYV